MKIEVVIGDITGMKAGAIVNPANSSLTMGGGLALIMKKKGGHAIEKEALVQVPVGIGKAVITSAGRLPAGHVIHAPTMERPAERTTPENVRLAMRASLECADRNGIRELAVPGLGTGVGGVPFDEAAKAMVSEAKAFNGKRLHRIIFVAFDSGFFEALKKEIS